MFLIELDMPLSETSVIPANGIWKSTDKTLSFYLQEYQSGACITVVTLNGVDFAAYPDADYSDGIRVWDDLGGRGYPLTLALADSSHGSLTATLPGNNSVTKLVERAFSGTRSSTPQNGIWRSEDDALSFYPQKYEGGSCILVATMDGVRFALFPRPGSE
ncbi:MAG: hypothetical protein HY788_04370 [Deltaproteobacteria bacterium]|nr:hypothetical protein [Deltaproteobacteria bacterium]